MHSIHHEPHFSNRNNWLRATVLGANDGLISTASLLMGVAAAQVDGHVLMLTGVASLIAGAISMAAGEYVSVSSQSDTEKADLAKEAYELEHNAERELTELTHIYINRGLTPELAHEVAVALTHHDALEAHARDEIGILEQTAARPFTAAFSSASAFTVGSLFPLVSILVLPSHLLDQGVMLVGVLSLGIMGALASYAGGGSMWKGALRVMIWGIVAMLFSFWIGSLFNVTST